MFVFFFWFCNFQVIVLGEFLATSFEFQPQKKFYKSNFFKSNKSSYNVSFHGMIKKTCYHLQIKKKGTAFLKYEIKPYDELKNL